MGEINLSTIIHLAEVFTEAETWQEAREMEAEAMIASAKKCSRQFEIAKTLARETGTPVMFHRKKVMGLDTTWTVHPGGLVSMDCKDEKKYKEMLDTPPMGC